MKSHERHARSVGLCLLCCLIFFEYLAARDFIYPLNYALCSFQNHNMFPFKKKKGGGGGYTNAPPPPKQPPHLLHILNYDVHFSFCEIIPYDATLFLGIS
jgi:hypothetical protein